MLKPTGRLLYLGLVLIANDCVNTHETGSERAANGTITCSEHAMNVLCTCRERVVNVLDQLVSLQLVSYTKKALKKEDKEEKERRGEKNKKQEIQANLKASNSNVVSLGVEPSVQLTANKFSSKELLNKKANLVIASYCDSFKRKYSANPTLDPKDIGQLQRLCKVYGADKLSAMAQVYVQMKDPFFEKRKHDLGTFVSNINKVGLATQTGEDDNASAGDQWLRSREKSSSLV